MKRSRSRQAEVIRWMLLFMYGTSLSALFLVPAFYILRFPGGLSNSQEVWAQAGDYFSGILNPIISFSALLGLMVLIMLEYRALETAKKELKTTNEAFRDQNVSGRYFRLLELVIRAAERLAKTKDLDDQDLLANFIGQLVTKFKRGDFDARNVFGEMKSAFNTMALSEEFRSYVRAFGATFDYMEREPTSENDKQFYRRTLSSVIADRELFGFGLWVRFQGDVDASVRKMWRPYMEFASHRLVEPYKSMLFILDDSREHGTNV